MASIEEIREEAVRSRAFIRGAETQLGKVLALIDEPVEPEPELEPGTESITVELATHHGTP